MKTCTTIFFACCAVIMAACNNAPEKNVPIACDSINDSIVNTSDTLIVVGVGDIMLGTIIPSREFLPPGEDCSGELKPTSHIFQDADVAFCNLEGVFTDTPTGRKSCKNPDVCYTFGMPVKFAACLAEAGFDLVSIANNHCGDFGAAGRQGTMNALKQAGLQYAGQLTCPKAIYTNNGVTYGFCAFSPENGNCDMRKYSEAQQIVRELDSVCDIVIVSFHSGAEGVNHQHVPKADEMFMGYNRGNVHKFAHSVIDAGADVVFGHGPHVTRAVEVYNDRFIAYSMGNFCTYSKISVSGACGLAPIIKLWIDKEGKFLKGQIFPTFQIKYQPPAIDETKRVTQIIRDLTAADFPDTPINISEDGIITPK